MHVVIFEVEPTDAGRDEYLSIAGGLRAELEKIDGFISIERFESLVTPGKVLSLSTWRDEAAIKAWRSQTNHRAAQDRGREELFAGYRIRIAQVSRDYDMTRAEPFGGSK